MLKITLQINKRFIIDFISHSLSFNFLHVSLFVAKHGRMRYSTCVSGGNFQVPSNVSALGQYIHPCREKGASCPAMNWTFGLHADLCFEYKYPMNRLHW
jgi:hypothetical protein